MSYDSIPDSWREIGKAVKKDLIDRIHDNLEDLNGRVINVEGSISTTVIANASIKKEHDHAPIGTMVWSPLDSTKFAAAIDDGQWQLCDGTSVSGSDYATLMSRTTAPDLRGKFMRMRAHGTGTTYNDDGDVATDTVQAYVTAAHLHNMSHTHANTFAVSGSFGSAGHTHDNTHSHIYDHTHSFAYYDYTFSPNPVMYAWQSSAPSTTSSSAASTAFMRDQAAATSGSSVYVMTRGQFSTQEYFTSGVAAISGSPGRGSGSSAETQNTAITTGGPSNNASPVLSGSVTAISASTALLGAATETRPNNVTEECYIKINKNYVTVKTGYLLWRAPQALTINQVVLTPVTQGTSGTLTVDVKKGPFGSVTTSIFTSTPSLLYSDTSPTTGTINATNAVIAAGDYVRVDITATQAKLQEFHILIAATPA